MSVDILHEDLTLWACGGTNGKAIFQVGDQRGDTLAVQGCSISGVVLVDAPLSPAAQAPIVIDYGLSEALDIELEYLPPLNESLEAAVRLAIAHLSFRLLEAVRMKTAAFLSSIHHVNGRFESATALNMTLKDLGLDHDSSAFRVWLPDHSWTGSPAERNGLLHLVESAANSLKGVCHLHKDGGLSGGRCICCHVGRLIHAFASTAVALVQCRYESSQVRVRADVINGKVNTSWSRGCIFEDNGSSLGCLDSHQLLYHLSQLMPGNGSDFP
ncbi:hypothetical protein BDW68DRAFT_182854 [Aspergillus falconensis]